MHIRKEEHRKAELRSTIEKYNQFSISANKPACKESKDGLSPNVASLLAKISSMRSELPHIPSGTQKLVNPPPGFPPLANSKSSVQSDTETNRSSNDSRSNILAHQSANSSRSNNSAHQSTNSSRSNISVQPKTALESDVQANENEKAKLNTSDNTTETSATHNLVVRLITIPWAASKRQILDRFGAVNILNGPEGIHFIVDKELDRPNNAFIELGSLDDYFGILDLPVRGQSYRGRFDYQIAWFI